MLRLKDRFKRISIDDSLVKLDEKEILEDLITAAINDAKEKGETAANEEMKSLTGGFTPTSWNEISIFNLWNNLL